MPIRIKKKLPMDKKTESLMVGLSDMPSSSYYEYGSGILPNAQKSIEIDEFYIDNKILKDLEKESESILAKKEFEDFSKIINKIANSIDYETRLKKFIIKIYESDHFDKINNIKNVTSDYFRNKMSFINSGKPEVESSRMAFEIATESFLSEYEMFYKKAQYSENSPVYVAEELAAVIKIMLQRIKPESRLKSMNSIRDKIKDINIPELAGKKSPGGAAIGVTLSLIKNILMARDQFFIDAVLKELILRL